MRSILLASLAVLPLAACHGRPAPLPPVVEGSSLRSSVPRLEHVWLLVEENAGLSEVLRATAAMPYLHRELLPRAALLMGFHAVAHPSLPNYLALAGGDTFGVTSDGDATDPGHEVPTDRPSLADELSRAGRSWKAYAESMPSPCDPASSGRYAARHNPFPFFLGLQGTAACRENDLPLDEDALRADLAAGKAPSFTFLAPNLCDDGHDSCGGDRLAHTDAFLARVVPEILGSPAFQKGGALFLTWDEDDARLTDNRVPLLVLSPLLARPGARENDWRDDYGLLATIEDALGVPRLAKAAHAAPIDGIWRSGTP